MKAIGIDGCPGGWITVSRDCAWVNESLAALLAEANPDITALDMPIGLSDDQPRACDIAARRLLGRPRGSSVFPTPMRATLAASSHVEAGDINAAACGKRISAQAYNLLPKIREVDTLLRASIYWRKRVFEVHPEVSFATINNGQPIAEPKRRAAGRAQRQKLIAHHFGTTAFERVRAAIHKRDAADDDIADAFACLYTAERIAANQHVTVPDPPEIDRQGLPMRICC